MNEVNEQLEKLRQRLGVRTAGEVMAKSLSLLDLFLDLRDDGDIILVKHDDGTTERMDTLNL